MSDELEGARTQTALNLRREGETVFCAGCGTEIAEGDLLSAWGHVLLCEWEDEKTERRRNENESLTRWAQ
jgi:hypothetical protein